MDSPAARPWPRPNPDTWRYRLNGGSSRPAHDEVLLLIEVTGVSIDYDRDEKIPQYESDARSAAPKAVRPSAKDPSRTRRVPSGS